LPVHRIRSEQPAFNRFTGSGKPAERQETKSEEDLERTLAEDGFRILTHVLDDERIQSLRDEASRVAENAGSACVRRYAPADALAPGLPWRGAPPASNL
jgi:hypothetical protein